MTPETILSNIDITVTVIHPHDPERPAGVVGEYRFPTLWAAFNPGHTADHPQRCLATLRGLSIADALEVIFCQTNYHDGLNCWLRDQKDIKARSTSVGDMVHIRQGDENSFWRCEGAGWVQLNARMFWRCKRISPRDASMNLAWLLENNLVPAFSAKAFFAPRQAA